MIRLDDRLRCAFDLLRGSAAVADIGSDHGKLTAALLLEGGCRRVIAGDISPDCLQKTSEIIERYGLQDKAETRLGSGLSILSPGECDAAAILGMGGELMVELLQSEVIINGTKRVFTDAVGLYVQSVFKALEEADISLICFYEK